MPFQLITYSAEETQQFGYQLGQCLKSGDIVCLSGDLGAGKTTLAVGIGRGWDAEYPLTSPTFVIVQQYKRLTDKQRLHHIDAYRLEDDADSIGLDDILDSDGPVLIEWPEHIEAALPPDVLWIDLQNGVERPSERGLTLTPRGPRSQALLDALQNLMVRE